MAILLELKPEVEARLQAEADAKGVALVELAGKLIEDHAVAPPFSTPEALKSRLMGIAKEAHALPSLDTGTADEIVGYDGDGLP